MPLLYHRGAYAALDGGEAATIGSA